MKRLLLLLFILISINCNATKYKEIYDMILINKLPYPEIIMSQVILETGHMTSKLYKYNNNLFGLYNSKTRKYYKFKTRNHSIIAYKKYILNKYKNGEDYYVFLKRIGYAKDSKYIAKVRGIEKRLRLGEFGDLIK